MFGKSLGRQLRQRLEVLEDAILSPDDRQALDKVRKEFAENKTVHHNEVTRKLL